MPRARRAVATLAGALLSVASVAVAHRASATPADDAQAARPSWWCDSDNLGPAEALGRVGWALRCVWEEPERDAAGILEDRGYPVFRAIAPVDATADCGAMGGDPRGLRPVCYCPPAPR